MRLETIAELVARLDELDDDLIIYAQGSAGWNATTPAAVLAVPEDEDVPLEPGGLTYFLDVSLAREAVEVWSEWRDGRTLTLDEACEAVIYYAANDAYINVQEPESRPESPAG